MAQIRAGISDDGTQVVVQVRDPAVGTITVPMDTATSEQLIRRLHDAQGRVLSQQTASNITVPPNTPPGSVQP